ncbi:MAG: sigma-70 family RNA polymerase sigma factor [bacterium]|nr:sigma-70 family RNA polymerase sigma factor [bacterium]
MPEPESEDRRSTVTRLLQASGTDQPQWAEELLPLIYDELRALARARMAREGAGQTIQATALVHDAYLRLVGEADPGWNGRSHFFGAAAEAMRRILVERARRRARLKHGGGRERVELDDDCAAIEPPNDDVLAVDEAVRKLEANDARKGRIVNLRYFAGLTAKETAEVLGLSLGTIEHEWRFIKVWLQDELEHGRHRQ